MGSRKASGPWRALGHAVCVAALAACVQCASAPRGDGGVKVREESLARLETRYAELLARHRPDLAARYGLPPRTTRFAPIDEAEADAHVRGLEALLAAADSLGHPAAARQSARVDTLRARIEREIAETVPGGALRRDAFLWLDIVEAAAAAPFAAGGAGGCDRTRRATLALREIPEALRGAAVLMRGANAPDPASLESRLARLESFLRRDLPARIDACKEARRLAEFVEADTLAATSLVVFRHALVPGE